ncbi:MAG TPA: hypothetical protein VGE74_19210, partial [Gemmata sp.]
MLKRLAVASGLATVVGCSSLPDSGPFPHPTSALGAKPGPAPVNGSGQGVVQVAATQPKPLPLPDRLPAPAEPPAQSSAPLSIPGEAFGVETAEQLAWANNPTLVQARAQVDGTLGKALQAGLWPNPVLGYQAEK